jgi:hydrogenase maturation protein HypF
VFQNALLVERVTRAAGPGARVLRHAAVPPGDGGLALGQAVIASAVVSSGRREVEEDVCA